MVKSSKQPSEFTRYQRKQLTGDPEYQSFNSRNETTNFRINNRPSIPDQINATRVQSHPQSEFVALRNAIK